MEVALENQFPGKVETGLIELGMKIRTFLVAPIRPCSTEKSVGLCTQRHKSLNRKTSCLGNKRSF